MPDLLFPTPKICKKSGRENARDSFARQRIVTGKLQLQLADRLVLNGTVQAGPDGREVTSVISIMSCLHFSEVSEPPCMQITSLSPQRGPHLNKSNIRGS